MRKAALLVLVVAAAWSCHRGDPVARRVDAVVAAVEDRDAGDVGKSISYSFKAEDGETKEQVLQTLRQYLFAYQNISVDVQEMKIAHGDDRADADFIANVRGNPKTIGGLDQLVPRWTKLRIHAELQREGSDWKIIAASWERLE